jgi:hypothetical protein
MSTTHATIPVTLNYVTPIHTLATFPDVWPRLHGVATVMPDNGSPIGYHCATNGKTLAIVPFQGCAEWLAGAAPSMRVIPASVIKGIKPIKGTRSIESFPNGSTTGTDGTTHDGDPTTFPRVSEVLDNLKDGSSERVVVSLNAKLLYELAQALGSDGCVTMYCDPQGIKASVVIPVNGKVKDALGVIMPIKSREGDLSANMVTVNLAVMAKRFAAVAH